MDNKISKEYNWTSLLRFTAPTIIMMVFMSLYTIIDGIFVSRFVGTNALSAVNIVYPAINIVIAVGIMLATGGSALIAKRLGEHKIKTARQNFTLIVIIGILMGFLIALLGNLFLEPICYALGANENIIVYCKDYLRILLFFAPASILQLLFQAFFVTAGKPMLGLFLTVMAGLLNALLDYCFIIPLNMGITGAALATAIGYLLPAIAGLLYFGLSKNELRFCRPKWDGKALLQSCFNGSSEMVTNISTAVTTFMFNILIIRLMGENGVAALTIVLYSQFLLTSFFLGFSMGVAPIISYNYGSQNILQLKRILKTCYIFVGISSLFIYLASTAGAASLVMIFSPVGSTVYDIALNGFYLFSFSYLFCGINIFASAYFTALSDGKTSALLSFMRTFVFIILGLLLLPSVMKENGLWLAIPFAELATMLISLWFLIRKRNALVISNA